VVVTHICAVVAAVVLLAALVSGVVGRSTVNCSAGSISDSGAYGACGSDWVTFALVALLILFAAAPVVALGVGLSLLLKTSNRAALIGADVAFLVLTWPFLWVVSTPADWINPFTFTLSSTWPWYLSVVLLLTPVMADWWFDRASTVVMVPVWTRDQGFVWQRFERRRVQRDSGH
jgi:hypothetical protein